QRLVEHAPAAPIQVDFPRDLHETRAPPPCLHALVHRLEATPDVRALRKERVVEVEDHESRRHPRRSRATNTASSKRSIATLSRQESAQALDGAPSAHSMSQRGKSAPASRARGNPPPKRGLISMKASVPSGRRKHCSVSGPNASGSRSATRRPHASSSSSRTVYPLLISPARVSSRRR